MGSVMSLIAREILHSEVGCETQSQPSPRLEDLSGHPGRFTMLQRKKNNILPPGRLSGRSPGESPNGSGSERRMHFPDRFAGLTPAGSDTLRHLRMLEQETQQLAGRIPGAADDGDLHRESSVASPKSRVAKETAPEVCESVTRDS